MSDETTAADPSAGGNDNDAVVTGAAKETTTNQATAPSQENVAVQTPEFVQLQDGGDGQAAPLDRFYDVDVTVWAELGRVTMSLGEMMKLGANSVIKLGRPVSAPVELMAQGVRFATGEVVVIDDCFAVRIQEIDGARRGD